MAFLRSYLTCYKWLGMFAVVLGLVVVGVADLVYGEGTKQDFNNVLSGKNLNLRVSRAVFLIFDAQATC